MLKQSSMSCTPLVRVDRPCFVVRLVVGLLCSSKKISSLPIRCRRGTRNLIHPSTHVCMYVRAKFEYSAISFSFPDVYFSYWIVAAFRFVSFLPGAVYRPNNMAQAATSHHAPVIHISSSTPCTSKPWSRFAYTHHGSLVPLTTYCLESNRTGDSY